MQTRAEFKANDMFDRYFEKWIDDCDMFKKSIMITLYPDTYKQRNVEIPIDYDYLREEMRETWLDVYYNSIESNERVPIEESNAFFNSHYTECINTYLCSENAVHKAEEYQDGLKAEFEEMVY